VDIMLVLHKFGTKVVEALNENNVQPPQKIDPGFFGGIIVMAVYDDSGRKRRRMPLAGSLNYDKETEKWVWTEQLEQAAPVADEFEQG